MGNDVRRPGASSPESARLLLVAVAPTIAPAVAGPAIAPAAGPVMMGRDRVFGGMSAIGQAAGCSGVKLGFDLISGD